MKGVFQQPAAAVLIAALALLSACESGPRRQGAPVAYGGTTPSAPLPQNSALGGAYKIGNPYQIAGRWYYPKENYHYLEEGVASWYGPNFHGKLTANGELYDQHAMTAAHRTLPLPSVVRVTNLENGRQVVLRVNDRGPFAKDRIIDISRSGAEALDFISSGTTRVRVEILSDESRALKAALLAGEDGAGTGFVAAPSGSISAQPLDAPMGSASASSEVVPAARSDSLLRPWRVETSTGAPSAPAAPSLNAPDPGTLGGSSSERMSLAGLESLPAAAPVSSAALAGRFIQAGAYSSRSGAEQVRAELATLGPALLVPVTVNGQELYRVRLGPLDDGATTDTLLARVRAAGYPDAVLID